MTANPFAALITEKATAAREVFDGTCDTAKQAVDYFEQLLLAALAAAVLDDLAEAGKVLEALEARCNPYDYDPLARNAADQITSLLARIAALEETIKGLAMDVLASSGQAQEAYQAQVAAETALAAERAKTAKLVEAGKRVLDAPFDTMEEHNAVTDLRAAITEASQ